MNTYRHLYKNAFTPRGEQYKSYQNLQRAIRKKKVLFCREQVPDTNHGTTLPNRDDPPQTERSRDAAGTQQERRRDPPKPTGDPQNPLETIMMRKHQTTKYYYRWKPNTAGTQGGFMIYDEMKLQGKHT